VGKSYTKERKHTPGPSWVECNLVQTGKKITVLTCTGGRPDLLKKRAGANQGGKEKGGLNRVLVGGDASGHLGKKWGGVETFFVCEAFDLPTNQGGKKQRGSPSRSSKRGPQVQGPLKKRKANDCNGKKKKTNARVGGGGNSVKVFSSKKKEKHTYPTGETQKYGKTQGNFCWEVGGGGGTRTPRERRKKYNDAKGANCQFIGDTPPLGGVKKMPKGSVRECSPEGSLLNQKNKGRRVSVNISQGKIPEAGIKWGGGGGGAPGTLT